jgi:hypothetical protein
VGLVAERALAAGFGDGPLSGSRAERYQVVLHVEEAALAAASPAALPAADPTTQDAMAATRVSAETWGSGSGDVSAETWGHGSGDVSAETWGHGSGDVSAATWGEAPRPRSELEDGVRVSAETSRRIACDAAVVRVTRGAGVTRGGAGAVLDVGRRTRTVPPALRRALEARDRGCRFPGCAARFTDAHHIVHWADGGETRLENLLLLCRGHHRAVHEGRVRVCRGADDSVAFFTAGGRALYDAPRRAREPAGTAGTEEAKRDGRNGMDGGHGRDGRNGLDGSGDWDRGGGDWDRGGGAGASVSGDG